MGLFRYVYLTEEFYQVHSGYKEMLLKKERPYLHVLVKYQGYDFVIPFRSELKHRYGFRFSKYDNKGLDFTKSILIKDVDRFLVAIPKNIPRQQHAQIVKNEKKILRTFHRYIIQYSKAIESRDENQINRMARFSTLVNFHEELEIN